MSVQSILKLGDPILREKSTRIEDFAANAKVFVDLNDTLTNVRRLYQFENGTGLAAPQIGYLVRAIAIDFDGKRQILINPEIVEASTEMIRLPEGCLSFFDFRAAVERHKRVKVNAFNEKGEEFQIEAEGQLSKLLQHEIDHLDGILYFDRLPNGKEGMIPVSGRPRIP